MAGTSPPRDNGDGVDTSQFAMAKFLKKELKGISNDTMSDQEEKFEARFGMFEEKLKVVAKSTGAGLN